MVFWFLLELCKTEEYSVIGGLYTFRIQVVWHCGGIALGGHGSGSLLWMSRTMLLLYFKWDIGSVPN